VLKRRPSAFLSRVDVQHGKGLTPWGSEEPQRGEPEERHKRLLFVTRYVVPGVIALAGVVVMIVVSDRQVAFEIGAMFIGAAIAVFLLNFFFRMGASGDRERDREEDARRYFDKHGHWPGEKPGT
jgi:hypothetical protein